jgi:hypothetical protein
MNVTVMDNVLHKMFVHVKLDFQDLIVKLYFHLIVQHYQIVMVKENVFKEMFVNVTLDGVDQLVQILFMIVLL